MATVAASLTHGIVSVFILCILISFIRTTQGENYCNNVDGSLNSEDCTCGNERAGFEPKQPCNTPASCRFDKCTETTGLICYVTGDTGSCRKNEPGPYGYKKLPVGYCAEAGVAGRARIDDEASCNAAAVSLGLTDTKAAVTGSTIEPQGCYWYQQQLRFNFLNSATLCEQHSDFCICFSAPTCGIRDGTMSNAAPCLCGSATCTPSTGLYCDGVTSTCSRGDTCSNTDGSLANSVACACGRYIPGVWPTPTIYPVACNAFNGMYCDASSYKCSPGTTCPIDNGINTVDCLCGTSSCNVLSGMFCTASKSSCREARPVGVCWWWAVNNISMLRIHRWLSKELKRNWISHGGRRSGVVVGRRGSTT